MARRLSLREQLEQLASANPVDIDPEDAGQGSDDENLVVSQARRKKQTSLGKPAPVEHMPSKLRASEFAADLESHPRYKGHVVPVRSLAQNDKDDGEDDDDDDNSIGDEEMHDADDDDGSGEDNNGEDGDVDEDDFDDGDDASEEGDYRGGETGDVDADADAELQALAAADAAALSRYRRGQSDDAARGVHVRSQVQIAETCLEARIKLQKALTAGNALPRPELHAALCSTPAVARAFSSARTELVSLLLQLLRLRASLFVRIPAVAAAVANAGLDGEDEEAVQSALLPEGCPLRGHKRARVDDVNDDEEDEFEGEDATGMTSEAIWKAVQAGWEASSVWRSGTLDSAARRMTYDSSLSAKRASKLRVLGGDLSASVARMVGDDRERLIARTRLASGSVRHMGEQSAGEGSGDAQATAGRSLASDPDTYGDSELYASLLKEYLASTAATSNADASAEARAEAQASKDGYKHSKRDGMDRRASKGRRLRYITHPKLVAFSAPQPFVVPPELAFDVDALLASLFRG